jgi:hypothetical protein
MACELFLLAEHSRLEYCSKRSRPEGSPSQAYPGGVHYSLLLTVTTPRRLKVVESADIAFIEELNAWGRDRAHTLLDEVQEITLSALQAEIRAPKWKRNSPAKGID